MARAADTSVDNGWGPWVVHDGRGCPLRTGVIVEVVSVDAFGFAMRTMATVSGESPSSWDWSHYPELRKIIRYREKKPRGLQMLEEAMRTIPAPKKTAPTGPVRVV